MIIVKNNNNEIITINIDELENIFENDINTENIKEICIYAENYQTVNDFPFPDGNYKVKINNCNIENLPDNLPNTINSLNLSYNRFRNIDLRFFTHLKKLKIQHNRLISIVLPPNLEKLYCNNNRLANLSEIPNTILFIDICSNFLVAPIQDVNNQCVIISENNLYHTSNNNIYVDFFSSLPPLPSLNLPPVNNMNPLPTNNFFIDIPPSRINNDQLFNNNNVPTNSQELYEPLLGNEQNIPNTQEYDQINLDDIDDLINLTFFTPFETNIEEPNLEDTDILDDEEHQNQYKEKIERINKLVESEKIIIPVNFVCPISKSIFYNPVTLSDGHTYEKMHILEWIKYNNKSPMTNKNLINKNTSPNILIRSMVREWIDNIEKEYNIQSEKNNLENKKKIKED
jgi:hypothetical protein